MKCIILGNGKAPLLTDFKWFLKIINPEFIVCADGGANTAYKFNILPDFITGDFDSIKPQVYKYFKDKCEMIENSGQYDTDIEKSLKLALSYKCEEAFLFGVSGNRLDHSLANIAIALKFSDRLKISIISEKSILQIIEGSVELKSVPGEIISLFGIDGITSFTLKGFKYPLKNETLQFGVRESCSNESVIVNPEVIVQHGKGIIIRDHGFMRKNGLF
ncbi:MAG: thiamine diphosphokinase [Ignavibacteriaceae bacterium]|nr:thiamine diphosphokinase [Ignavibacteriaceae bacterium]